MSTHPSYTIEKVFCKIIGAITREKWGPMALKHLMLAIKETNIMVNLKKKKTVPYLIEKMCSKKIF